MDTDRKAAWDGGYASQPDLSIHVEAASYHGRPVWFRIVGPWEEALRMQPIEESAATTIANTASLTLYIAALVGGALLAWRYLRQGKGDRRGAFKVGGLVFVGYILTPLVRSDHAPELGAEFDILNRLLAERLFLATIVGLLYLAFEPSVRRHWPYALVSWNRLLVGRWRDPLVGRDAMVGAIAGSATLLVVAVKTLAPGWLGGAPLRPVETDASQLD